ncbi:aspartic proteinase CDR1-like [Andrographis paniculata]|uniref:aspartic proteinase CDR1-like n=1 Tax=Andrographis paniculata TaxID=175694 RepID=UPI0021E931B1|nr:aspartic proteinase CDR1-like [Andrographis paniculata]
MAINVKPYTIILFYFALISLLSNFRVSMIINAAAANITVVDLIPRDLLFNSSLTPSDRVRNSLLRSLKRFKFLAAGDSNFSRQALAAAATTDIVYDSFNYLMKFSIGTPPVEYLATADTGSDLTWIQCTPCRNCFEQTQPLFDRRRSPSYRPVLHNSATCRSTGLVTNPRGSGNTCGYSILYGDGSTSAGEIATERLAVGRLSIPNFVFGCGDDNRGFSESTAGIFGLAGVARVSLMKQAESTIRGKFAYCLPESSFHLHPEIGKLSFGGVVSGRGVVSTPLVLKPRLVYYHVTLEGITVGNQRLNWGSSSRSNEGNIVMDTGATLTSLPLELYERVVTAVVRQLNLRRKADPQNLLSVCFEVNRNSDYEKLPTMVVHFRGGADVRLGNYNAFLQSDSRTVCLAFLPDGDNLPVYGSITQANFIVGYDLERMRVSFKQSPCSRMET